MDPDELYTLRAQYWLGHYSLCIDEAKSIARRPMSPQLKMEREEFYLRALLESKQYDEVIRESNSGDKGPGRLVLFFVFVLFLFFVLECTF